MKTWERKIAPAGFCLAGVLFVVAAFVPTFRGEPFNVVFLPVGIVFGILGIVTWRRVQRAGSPPA
jgi:hypothetical protein